MKLLKNKLFTSISSAVLVTLVLSMLLTSGFLSPQSTRMSDLLYNEQKSLDEIVIIGIDDESINEIGRWPWSREVFAKALENLKGAEIIGIDVSFFEEGPGDEELSKTLEGLENVILVAECTEFSEEECEEWLFPIFETEKAAANIYVDNGVARSTPGDLKEVKSLSLAVSEYYLNSEVELKEKNFIYFHEPYNRISFKDVLEEDFDTELIKDKIVLIGATAKDLHDEKETPLGILPGVEIHANAIQSILSNKFLEYQKNSSIILTMLMLSFITALILYWARIRFATFWSILLILAYLILAIFSFDKGIIFNLFYPTFSVILSFFSILGIFYTTEAKERKWISEVFGKYVSPSVAKQIMEEGAGALQLKGSKKTVTTLFADIRGFTAMSEKHTPAKVVSLLNSYLEKMTDLVFDNGGTLDKYVGDEIMATYNVPLDQKNHALAAVKTALEMQETINKIGKGLKYGIGINTGPAIVGNIGGKKRLDYTVIGDSVNLAARLCSAAKKDQTLISEHTYKLVKNKIKAKALPPIKVKGKVKPINIYEVTGLK
ncbi:CHASE2 domain-containing protein [Nanoarchaeota archaeon]